MNSILTSIYAFSVQRLPYITLIVTFMGVALRVMRWRSSPPDPEKIKIDPVESVKYVILDVVLFRKTWKTDKAMWLALFLFHGSVAGIVFGHLRGFHIWSITLFEAFGHAFAEFMVHTLPIYVGYVFIITQVYFLARRVMLENKQLTSMPNDYIALVLLLMKSIAGQGMRLVAPEAVPTALYSVVFIPRFVVLHLETIPNSHWFHIHIILTQLFIMYVPFSKFIHIITGVITPAIYGSRRKQIDR
ncbi:MAG: respiratory nitrate reductase subunit gamma [Candidatus Bathyarchaeota archaeon]|nr:respiratory nitrate reductase subunit gamma [Candidatus Bathyarchaeota archaeon]